MAFDQSQYVNEYIKNNYDRINFKIPKGKRDVLKKTAEKNNTSVNQLIISAVEEKYKIDLTTKT